MAEPSKPIPSANAPSSSAGATAIDFSVPRTSVNHSRTNLMSRSSSVRSTNSSCLSTVLTLDVPHPLASLQRARSGSLCTYQRVCPASVSPRLKWPTSTCTWSGPMLINIGDVVDGALVSAIAVAGRRISVAVDGLRGRRRANDLTAARWFETYQMTSEAPGLPELPATLTERLAGILRG